MFIPFFLSFTEAGSLDSKDAIPSSPGGPSTGECCQCTHVSANAHMHHYATSSKPWPACGVQQYQPGADPLSHPQHSVRT